MTKLEYIHCAICGGIVKESESHNAEPVCSGRCCSICNTNHVIPARIEKATGQRQGDCPEHAKIRLTFADGSLPEAEIAAAYRKDKGGATISVNGTVESVGILLSALLKDIVQQGPSGVAILRASLMTAGYMSIKEGNKS